MDGRTDQTDYVPSGRERLVAISQSKVTELIAKFGRPATHVRSADTPADNEWDEPTGDEVKTLIDAVFLDFEHGEIDGDTIRRDDQRVLISGAVADVEKGHYIREGVSPANDPPDNVDWRIENTIIIEPGTIRYLYDLQVRK